MTRLDGAVESSIQLGVADAIADVVETGRTLRAAGLETFGEVVLESEAVLVTRAGAGQPDGFEMFKRRLEGVLVARSYVMMDYDIDDRQRRGGVRADSRARGPDRLAAASRGLGRGPGDGAARGRPAADGRALRPRRPRHPADRHPCLPALTRPSGIVAAAHLAAVRRRIAASVLRCLPADRLRWLPGSASAEMQAQFTPFQGSPWSACSASASLVWFALVRSRVVAEKDRLVVVNGYRTHVYEWAEVVSITLAGAPRGRPSTSPTAPRCPRSPSRAPTVTARGVAVRQLRALPGASAHRARRTPHDTDSSSPASPAGARVTRPTPELNALGGAVIGSTASDRRAELGTSSAV